MAFDGDVMLSGMDDFDDDAYSMTPSLLPPVPRHFGSAAATHRNYTVEIVGLPDAFFGGDGGVELDQNVSASIILEAFKDSKNISDATALTKVINAFQEKKRYAEELSLQNTFKFAGSTEPVDSLITPFSLAALGGPIGVTVTVSSANVFTLLGGISTEDDNPDEESKYYLVEHHPEMDPETGRHAEGLGNGVALRVSTGLWADLKQYIKAIYGDKFGILATFYGPAFADDEDEEDDGATKPMVVDKAAPKKVATAAAPPVATATRPTPVPVPAAKLTPAVAPPVVTAPQEKKASTPDLASLALSDADEHEEASSEGKRKRQQKAVIATKVESEESEEKKPKPSAAAAPVATPVKKPVAAPAPASRDRAARALATEKKK